MANTRSLSNATAERDQTMLRRVRHLGSARNGSQEWRLLDGARARSPGALFRRLNAAARHVGPHKRCRMARLAGAGAFNPSFRADSTGACGRRFTLDPDRLRARARVDGRCRTRGARCCRAARGRKRARRP